MLVKLTHFMIISVKLLKFFWKSAIAHTAYLKNKVFTSLQNASPRMVQKQAKHFSLLQVKSTHMILL